MENLRTLRRQQFPRVSQAKLARFMGWSQSVISFIELGKRRVSLAEERAILDALHQLSATNLRRHQERVEAILQESTAL